MSDCYIDIFFLKQKKMKKHLFRKKFQIFNLCEKKKKLIMERVSNFSNVNMERIFK